jgi:DnaJ-class molecular chaperone
MSIKKNAHPWEDKFKKPLERYVDCRKCKGKGKIPYLLIFYNSCENCRGSGRVRNI